MKRSWLLLVVALAACGDSLPQGDVAPHGDVAPPAERIPDALAQLTLVEDHPEISAAIFPHRLHVDAERMERAVACVECHHELADDFALAHPSEHATEPPTAPPTTPPAEPLTTIPRRCTECHLYAYLLPTVDERKPHDHDQPPDL